MLLVYSYIIDEINFVPQHDYLRVRICILLDHFQPVIHVFETVHVSNVIDDDDTSSALVVRVSQWSELDLACGVPNR